MSFNCKATLTNCNDFGDQGNKSPTVATLSPSIYHEVMGPDAIILVIFLILLSFKPTF